MITGNDDQPLLTTPLSPREPSPVQNGAAHHWVPSPTDESTQRQTDLLGGEVEGQNDALTPQQGSDVINDPFMDMNTQNTNTLADPMTQSFIDESTMGAGSESGVSLLLHNEALHIYLTCRTAELCTPISFFEQHKII